VSLETTLETETSPVATREKAAAEHGHAVTDTCEKCMGDYAMPMHYRPLGGATSFQELREYREAQKLEGVYSTATWDYRDLSSNILTSEMSIEEKVEALSTLTQEFQQVVTDINTFYPDYKEFKEPTDEVKKSILDSIRSVFSKSKKTLPDLELDFSEDAGFKVIRTKSGPRWVAYSSNAFKDKENEIFTTKALADAVEYADQSGVRGPLRIFHVPGTEVGDTDFQSVIGRFLVESGPFRDDEFGQKAVSYFETHSDEKFQVSIGFKYKKGDEEDGVFDWLRIIERSVTPYGAAANPFTSFAVGELGGKEMNERKMKMLTDIFGEDLASKIVGGAESKSKELEESVAFKSTGDLLEDLKTVVDTLPEESRQPFSALVEKYSTKPKDKDKDDEEDDDHKPPKGMMKDKKEDEGGQKAEADYEPLKVAVEALSERLEAIHEAIKQSVTTLEAEVKALKDKDAASPRGRDAFRASDANGNVVDPEKIKELIGESEGEPVNPARAYVEDLLNLGAVR
jgi:hypothetical protein